MAKSCTKSAAFYFQLLFVATWWSGSFVRMHCNDEVLSDVYGRKAIFLMNHHYEVDWLFAWMCADAFGILGIM